MKGDRAVCANPRCDKEFTKTRYNQKCCGSASCRTMYNRHKNGEPLVPDRFKRTRVIREAPAMVDFYNGNARTNFSSNLTNGVLNGAVGPAIVNAVGRGTFVGNIAASAVSSAVIPLIREFINSGNKIQFSSIDDDMNYWISQKEYWEKQRAKIQKGILPIKSIGGGLLGGVLGFMSVPKKSEESLIGLKKKDRKRMRKAIKKSKADAKRNAIIGGVILGGIGAYIENAERQSLATNGQSLADNADAKIIEAEHNINRLRREKTQMMKWVEDDILVEDGQGVYTVKKEIIDTIISADEYKEIDIPLIEFRGAYKYLLNKARENFYKIVSGLPEQGKTSYCVKFATYYSQNHGKVLYLPSEQSGRNVDFQEVLRRVGGKGFDIDPNTNNYSLDELLQKVKKYDLVILDSVNNMKLTANQVKEINKETAVMAVMQSTKAGGYKGAQDYFHDCDKFVIIDKLTASVSKSRGTNPLENREAVKIENLD